MDTISRENNSMLPVAGVIVGVLALLVGAYAAIKVSSLNKTVVTHEEKIAKIDGLESQIVSSSEKASRDINSLNRSTQEAFNTVAASLGNIQASITKIEESQKKPAAPAAAAAKSASSGPVVAGPDEYVIKSGDNFSKIARTHGFSLADLQAVNPGVNSSDLKIGQKIKLPKKK